MRLRFRAAVGVWHRDGKKFQVLLKEPALVALDSYRTGEAKHGLQANLPVLTRDGLVGRAPVKFDPAVLLGDPKAG